jgi:hypothetical protein
MALPAAAVAGAVDSEDWSENERQCDDSDPNRQHYSDRCPALICHLVVLQRGYAADLSCGVWLTRHQFANEGAIHAIYPAAGKSGDDHARE